MSHVEEGTLQAWIDGELGGEDLLTVESHAASCGVCQAEVRSLRALSERVHGLVAEYEGTLPIADFGTLGEIRSRARGSRRRLPVGLARAAMLLLALAGVVAAAVPGSPLRQWLEGLRGGATDEAPAPVEAAPETPARRGGVFVLPDQGVVRIRLTGNPSDLMVRLVDSAEAGVVWTGPDAGVRTRQTAGAIDVDGLPDGSVTVSVPRGVRSAIVEVNGRIWWQKSGSDVRIPGPTHREDGDEVRFQSGG